MAGIREFGDLIKSARVQQGITGTELANRMERSHSQIVRWENGTPSNPPDIDIFWDFSEALGIPPEKMLEALGYLKPDSERDQDPPAISALRAILEPHDFTEGQIRALVISVQNTVDMLKGNY